MYTERHQPDGELRFLRQLIDQHAWVAGDVIAVGARRWAIHGSILVDGEVIMAEFDDPERARAVLDRLPPNLPGL